MSLRACPAPGDGVHRWIFASACTLLKHTQLADGEIADWITENLTREPNPHHEVGEAIRKARQVITGDAPARVRVEFNERAARVVAENVPGDTGLRLLYSRSAMIPEHCDAAAFFRALYRPGERVLLFTDQRSQGVAWEPHSGAPLPRQRTGTEGAWFLCNPVTGATCLNRAGRLSRRSEDNLTGYRLAVLESDNLPREQWAAILVQLPLPIVSIVDSGGKSLHALVRVDAADKAEWATETETLRKALVPLGADPACLSAVRLTRLPWAMRGGRQQVLLYINPDADGTPIIDSAERRGQ